MTRNFNSITPINDPLEESMAFSKRPKGGFADQGFCRAQLEPNESEMSQDGSSRERMESQLMDMMSSTALDKQAPYADYNVDSSSSIVIKSHAEVTRKKSSAYVKHFNEMTDLEKKQSIAIGMASLKIEKEPNDSQDQGEHGIQRTSFIGCKLLDMFQKIIQPSLHFRLSNKIFRSNEAIINEQERQRQVNRYIIHPLSPFRTAWDLVMVLMLSITLIILPMEIAFYTDELTNSKWAALNLVLDTVFFMDIAINFRTAFVHHATEEVILTNFPIIKHYVTTWFFVDLVSTVPFDYIYLGIQDKQDGSDALLLARTLRALRLTKLLSLLRIFRLARLVRYIHKVEEMLQSEARLIGIGNLAFVMLVFVHWNACCQYLVAFLSDFPPTSWVVTTGLVNSSMWDKYSWSVFRAMSHVVSVGYGQEPPRNTNEVWMTVFSTMLGASFYAIFVAHMSSIIITADSSGKVYEERITQVKEYMRFRRVPMQIQTRVLEYYDHRYQRKFFDEWSILHEQYMSYPLRKDILMHNCRSLVEKVALFQTASVEFLVELITKLQFQVFFPGDIIIQAGRRGEAMFFIEHGRVEVKLPSGKVVNFLGDGMHFGEIALVLEERRVASVIATDITDIYCLSKKDFNSVLQEFPEMRKSIEDVAKERMLSNRSFSEAEPESSKSPSGEQHLEVEVENRTLAPIS